MEKVMDKKKIKYYETRLLERRAALTGIVERTENYGREADTDLTQDPADKASNAYTKELLFSQSTNDRFILSLIEEALNRIEDGEYGLCVHCGKEVQPKRLEAVPWARHCITCQDLQERGLLEDTEE